MGSVGAVWAPDRHLHVAFDFTIVDGRIVGIAILADRDRLVELGVTVLDD